MRRLFLTIILLMVTSCAFANEPILDEGTKKICNQVMLNIYYDILAEKDKHEELVDFGESSLYENGHGIIAIIYKHGEEKENTSGRKPPPYAFGVTIDALDEVTFSRQEGTFSYSFNVIGLKINGYQKKHILRTQFNILPLIQKHGNLLAEHQQKYMPLKLYLLSTQKTFSVREDILFELILKNVTKRHMVVKSLGVDTLYFLVNGRSWGTKVTSANRGGKDIILKAGESLKLLFKGESFQRPQDVVINAFYKMGIKGVYPSASLKIKVVDN